MSRFQAGLRAVVLVALAVAVATPAAAQWEYVGPGFFTPIGVAQHESRVFFAASRGAGANVTGGLVYRSPDGRTGWEPVPDPLVTADRPDGPHVTAIGAGAGTVVIATRESFNTAFVYVSTDDGASWTARTTVPAVAEGGIQKLVVVDATTFVALAATGTSGSGRATAFVTTDAGATWTARSEVLAASLSARTVYAGGRLVQPFAELGSVGLYVSDDLGDTWAYRPYGSTLSGTTAAPRLTTDGDRVYLYATPPTAPDPVTLAWTDDGGQTFSEKAIAPSPTAGTVHHLAVAGDRVVVRGYISGPTDNAHTVATSADFGDTWTAGDADETILRSLDGREVRGQPLGVTAVPGGFLYSFVLAATNASALYASADGLDWAPAPVAGFEQDLGGTVVLGGEVLSFEGRGGAFYRAEAGSVAWRVVSHLGDAGTSACGSTVAEGLAAVVDGRVVAVCAGVVFHSTDGRSFDEVATAPEAFDMMVEDGGRLFGVAYDAGLSTGGQRGTLYGSADGGRTWTALATGLRSFIRPSVAGDRVLLAEAGSVYLSTDAGASFAPTLSLPGGSFEVGAAATPTALFAGAAQTHPILNTDQFFRSLDGGATWENLITAGVVADGPHSLHALADGSVAAVFTDSVAVSSDDGTTWRGLAEGWPAGRRGEDAFVRGDTLYVQLYFGSLWRAALADFTGGGSVAAEDGAGAALDLAVWPNPASGVASVRFALAAPGRATLEVVDVLGRTVARLPDRQTSAGPHTLPLDTSALAPGVYVVRLVLDDGRRVTRSLTVAR